MLASAQRYLAAGLCVLPAVLAQKRPAVVRWKHYQRELPTAANVEKWFATAEALCVVTGAISGNLELIDFDFQAALYDAWVITVNGHAPELVAKLVVERSKSGGKHVVYRCEGPISGNAKLAQRVIEAPSEAQIDLAGKQFRPRRMATGWGVTVSLIETRGEGGLFLCDPTPGYQLMQGDLANPPVLTIAERETLLSAARCLNEVREPEPTPIIAGARPGDEYAETADVRPLLTKHGWAYVSTEGENEHWRRPGKEIGMSATLRGKCFYCFSTNAAPFEGGKAYGPFQVYALLEHGGDYRAAAQALRAEGYGRRVPDVDLSQFHVGQQYEDAEIDPGPLPDDLLSVPGYIDQVIAYNLSTAPRPQPILALGGAICLMSILAGRKIKDYRENRTNLTVLCLAGSGEGKGHARKVNQRILRLAGLEKLEMPPRIASDAGMLQLLIEWGARLWQPDEFGRHMATMADPRRAPHLYGIVTTMMELHSEADGIYHNKAYADQKKNHPIDQPFLTTYAVSAIDSFRRALTTDNLGDGSIARFVLLEPGPMSNLTDVPFPQPPAELIDVAQIWGGWNPGGGNLGSVHPEPTEASITPDARKRLAVAQTAADVAVRSAGDWRGAVWARTAEKACRLALIYACSVVGAGVKEGELPTVDESAADWACRLAEHCTRRLIWWGVTNVARNPFEAEQQAILELVRREGSVTKTQIARATRHLSPRQRDEMLQNLEDAGDLFSTSFQTGGRMRLEYRLMEKRKKEESISI